MSKILIVDDSEQDRYMLKVLLEGYGYEVVEAVDGEDALKKARQEPPDLIVTDILMPVKDGFALCRDWKKDKQLNHIPFVYYTATYTDNRDEKFARSLGADKFLIKPTEPDELVGALQDLFSESKKGEAPALPEQGEDEHIFLKKYSQALIRKLEDKLIQLEETNRALNQEMAEHKQTEGKLRKSNRALHTLSDVNQTLIRPQDEKSLLHNVCEILVEVGGYCLAWVGMALHDEAKTIHPSAHAGGNGTLLSHSRLTWGETGTDAEPTAIAIGTGETVIIADIANSPVHKKWLDRCLQLGFLSAIALPLKIDREVIGALSIFSNSVDLFDSEEVTLLEELADDLAFGIRSLQVAVERDKVKADLVAANEHLAATINALPDLMFEVDSDGRIYDYRATASELLYVSPEDFLGKTMREVLPPEAGLIFMATIKKAEKRGIHTGDQYFLELATGVKWFELSIAAKGDRKKSSNRFIALARDITERKLAEEAMRNSEAKYQDLYDEAPVAYFSVDSDGRITAVNKAAVKLTGYPKKQLMKMKIYNLYSEESLGKAAELFRRVGRGLTISNEEMVYKKKNGQLVHGLLSVSPREGEAGQVVERKSVVIDITQRLEAEKALETSESKYRGLVENVPVSICEGDFSGIKQYIENLQDSGLSDFRKHLEQHPEIVTQCINAIEILDVNQFTLDMLNAKNLQEVKNKIGRIIEGSHDTFMELVLAIAQGKRQFRTEMTLTTLNENKIHVSLNLVVAPGHEKTYDKMLVSMTDNTERKKLEEQLLQSQKMEAVGRLAGGVAHDFNNLLTVIMGYCQILMPTFYEHDPIHSDIKQINEAAERASSLTSQLLAFSRRQVLQLQILDCNKLISSMEKMLRRLIREDIEMEIELAENLGNIKADYGQIEQVIMNLVVNARDALPTGGKLSIATKNISYDEKFFHNRFEVQAGDYVILTISDTGPGIPRDIQDKIFDPFFTTKEKGQGTGLGLSTVYGIVKQTGGYLWVSSETGKGTSFTICMPMIDETVKLVTEVQEPEIVRGVETVLVVEDDDTVRTLTCKVLKKYGYSVLEAENGGAAMLICEKHKEQIHLVLTDVIMPMMSGLEFIKRLTPLHPELKVLYMSGYTDELIDSEAIKIPGTGFIQKPFSPLSLIGKVREVLNG